MSKNPCLNNTNQTHYHDLLHDIEIIGYRYITLIICIFGIVCNILNLCVLLQRRLKESPYTYLTGLAVADMLTLVFISPVSVVRGDYIRNEQILFDAVRFEGQIYMPLANYFGQVSIMITLALTIERYLFTTYPLRTRSFCKPRYARIIIAIIIVLCAMLSCPRFLFDTVNKNFDDYRRFNSIRCVSYPFVVESSSRNTSYIGQCFCVEGQTRKISRPIKNIYYIIMLMLNQVFPVIILFFLNLKLILRVQQSNRYTLGELVARQHTHLPTTATPSIHPIKQKRLRDEHRLTKTLVAVVVIFLVCNTFTIISYPDLVKQITKQRYPNYMATGFRVQKLITNIMLLLNYSINFFFYCAFNQKFLDTLKSTFQHRLCFSLYDDYFQPNENLTNQRTFCHSTTSSYLPSKCIHSSKRFSAYDDESQELKSSKMVGLRKTSRDDNLNP